MDTTYLKEYVALAEAGSFTTAAAQLHITQSTLSKHIAALERELSVDLFVRDKKGIKLTRAGSTFYRGTLLTLRTLNDAIHDAKTSTAEASDIAISTEAGTANMQLRTLCRIASGRFGLTPEQTGALILYLEDRGFAAIGAELGCDRDHIADLLAEAYTKMGTTDKQAALDVIYSISE